MSQGAFEETVPVRSPELKSNCARNTAADTILGVSPVIRKPFTPLLLWQAYYSTTGQPPCGILNQRDSIFADVVRSPRLERESGRWASYGGFGMREFVHVRF